MLVSTNEQASTISFTVFREVNEDCCATTPFQQFYHIKEWGGLIVSNKTKAFGVSPEFTSWQLTTQSISKKKSVGYHTMSLFLMVCIISNCTFINLFKIFLFSWSFITHLCICVCIQVFKYLHSISLSTAHDFAFQWPFMITFFQTTHKGLKNPLK